MANPRRASSLHLQSFSDEEAPLPQQPTPPSPLLAIVVFLKRPHAFPFLLSLFVLLTWVSLRNANLMRFSSVEFPSQFLKDKRGWLLNPVTAARNAGIFGKRREKWSFLWAGMPGSGQFSPGGAMSCASVHVGEIRPGGVRGNHRHHGCNETFIIWGAATKFRLENPNLEVGYAEATVGADEVAIAASPSGKAHAIVNVDPQRTTFFLGCQDSSMNYNDSSTDFNVWKGL